MWSTVAGMSHRSLKTEAQKAQADLKNKVDDLSKAGQASWAAMNPALDDLRNAFSKAIEVTAKRFEEAAKGSDALRRKVQGSVTEVRAATRNVVVPKMACSIHRLGGCADRFKETHDDTPHPSCHPYTPRPRHYVEH
jgi:hypothetical protein